MKVKPIINKKTGQINISLPKKKMDKKLLKEILKGKCINLNIKVSKRWLLK